MKVKRYTQQSFLKLILEKLVKSNIIFYKIAFVIKEKLLDNLFYEEDLNGIELLKISQNKSCIDVGANVGQSIEYFKNKFRKVYAFEPNPKNYKFLKRKYKKNKNILIFDFALGNKTEKKILFIPFWRHLISLHHTASFYKNECYSTLKEFLNLKKSSITFKTAKVKVTEMNKFYFKNISFIKIDAEGYEKEILLGMKRILKNKNITLLIENSSRSFNFCKKFLKNYGYEPFSFRNNKLTRTNVNKSLNVYFINKANISRLKI